MTVNDIAKAIEDFAPLSFQEPWDNSGLIVGNLHSKIDSVLLSLDITEDVIREAEMKGVGMIISHHPPLFKPIKRLTGESVVDKVVISAIKSDIAIYSAHTNLDNVKGGVSSAIANKLGLVDQKILSRKKSVLRKLVFFVPNDNAPQVRSAIFEAGAGHIGDYDQCSFNLSGEGSFRGAVNTNPFAGSPGVLHFEKELRVETIFPHYLENKIIKALLDSHPYEEVAYDIYSLENLFDGAGSGIVGSLSKPVDCIDFLGTLKSVFGTGAIKHSACLDREIVKVAVCGGSGAFLIEEAKRWGADIFITGDIKYHDFFEADEKIVIADVGHYESEQFATEIIGEILTKKFPNFAVHFSEVNTNPIQYFNGYGN